MIQTDRLTVRYPGGGGISDATLEVPAGATCAIIGASGCGKTTLLHCLAGLISPDSGTFSLGSDGRGRVGLVQQRDALFPWLTVAQNIELGLRALRTGSRIDRISRRRPARMDRLLVSLGIERLWDAYPHRLSGGERQRVAIARTLATQPDILLLDEPSSALDAFTREAIQDLLVRLQQEYRFTMLSVTHHIEEALFLAERIVVMGRGHIAKEIANPIYPDLEARVHQDFYARAVALREALAEVMARA